MLMRLIRFRLLPNVLVVARQRFVWQIFYTQNLLLLKSFERSEAKGRGILALRLAGFKNSVFMKAYPAPVRKAKATSRQT